MTSRLGIRDRGKKAAGFIAIGLDRVFGGRVRDPAGILLYHRVAPEPPGCPPPSLNVTPDRFRDQVTGLLEGGYSILSLGDILKMRSQGRPIPPRTIAITFDDGFASVYYHAWPIMKAFDLPATVFMITACLDSDQPFPSDSWGLTHRDRAPERSYRPLTTSECREMIQSRLVEIGSHTHTHRDFSYQPEGLADDTRRSVTVLRERFGLKEVSFAFPGGRRYLGQVSDDFLTAVRQTGVTCALTTECTPLDWRSDPFGWGRFNVYQWDTATTITAKLKGWYGWAVKLQERMNAGRFRN